MKRLAPNGHCDSQHGRDSCCLNGIELTHTARHEEAFEKAKHPGNWRPKEAQVKNTKPCAPQVKVMDAEAAQKQCEQNSRNLIASHCFELLIKEGLCIGIRLAAHGCVSLHCTPLYAIVQPQVPCAFM
jgi:hypothetical protein